MRIVLIFHRWNSINWNVRNQAASANFFFLFFKCACRARDLSIGDRFFIPDWIYTKAGIARGCYIKNEFSRPMLSTMVRCMRFFFHDLELLVTCRVIDNRWRQLNENHWQLEIEFSLRDTFHYYINGWIWILSFHHFSFTLYTREFSFSSFEN